MNDCKRHYKGILICYRFIQKKKDNATFILFKIVNFISKITFHMQDFTQLLYAKKKINKSDLKNKSKEKYLEDKYMQQKQIISYLKM